MRLARFRLWWAIIKQPANVRMVFANAMEFLGIGLVLFGLYMIHLLAFVIGLGGMCLLLAQGLSRRDET
jgi:hypothetical protein